MTKLKQLIWLAENVLKLPAGKPLHYAPPWDIGYVHPDTGIRETGQKDEQGRALVAVKYVHKPFYIPRADYLLVSTGIAGESLTHYDPFTDEAQASEALDKLRVKHVPPSRILELALRDRGIK
jgi:hypothetical protein